MQFVKPTEVYCDLETDGGITIIYNYDKKYNVKLNFINNGFINC